MPTSDRIAAQRHIGFHIDHVRGRAIRACQQIRQRVGCSKPFGVVLQFLVAHSDIGENGESCIAAYTKSEDIAPNDGSTS